MWTLYGGDDGANDGLEDEPHALLILGRQEGTMVLQTGQEIMELDQSGFATQGPTVFATNIGNDKFIVQVTPMSVHLLEGIQVSELGDSLLQSMHFPLQYEKVFH